jgi:hypothetical protein
MSLFDLETPVVNGTGATPGPGRRTFGAGTPAVALADAIGRLQFNNDVHYVSAGAWSLHDLVRYCLAHTGPGALIAFTWSLTPSAAAALIDMKTRGALLSLDLVMDSAQKKLSRGAFHTLRPHCARVRLCQIHAKGFLLAAGVWRVSVVTSQNMTTNPRYEVGVMSTAPVVYAFHRLWLDPLLDGGDPLDVERLATQITPEGDE